MEFVLVGVCAFACGTVFGIWCVMAHLAGLFK